MASDPHGDPDDDRRRAQRDAWSAFSLMVSGVLVWGGAGFLLSEWLGNRIFTMLGILVGMGAALYLVWLRYGRP